MKTKIKKQTISFEFKGKKHNFSFTPEDAEYCESFESHGIVFDVYYNEDYEDICVYEVIGDKMQEPAIYKKNILSKAEFDSTDVKYYLKDKKGKILLTTKSGNEASDFSVINKKKVTEMFIIDKNDNERWFIFDKNHKMIEVKMN